MKKRVTIIISILTAVCLVLTVCLGAFFTLVYRYKGKDIVYNWSKTDDFDIKNVISLDKEEDKDFIILNLADIQLCDIENFFNKKVLKKEIDYLIKTAKPDLITLTGDQTWSNENLLSLTSLIGWLESYKIPYAPVFGNHDHGNEYSSAVASLNYCCDLYENAEHCLFSRGPSNIGALGNYVINIKENGKIIKTLYMLDGGYNDEVTDGQKEWVKWVADGIKEQNDGNYTEGMCFMHKPLPQFASSCYSYWSGNSKSSVKVLVNSALYGLDDNGFYSVAKGIGINHFIAGHQHTNSFSIDYDDCVFTFALKTGELSYYYDDGETNFNGGTVFSIGDNTVVSNIYVDRNEYHIKGSENTFVYYD